MPLGFNLSIHSKTLAQVQTEIKAYAALGTDAIELSLTKAAGILEFPFAEIYPLLRQFHYISLHLPVISGADQACKEFLQYPNPQLAPQLKIIKEIAKQLSIDTFVIHPDQVTDFSWANQEFGELLGFENMDNLKNFGKTAVDLQKVFTACPQAKWIFDVNHLFTNDPSMQSAENFMTAFKSRLTHYHISAFGGFHDTFNNNRDELKILDAASDFSYPMIHEGFSFDGENYDELKKEYDLITTTIPSLPHTC